jgi:hypothetical protein
VPCHVGFCQRESATRTFAELLIDCEEDRILRAVLVAKLREGDRNAYALLAATAEESLPQRWLLVSL